MLGKKDIKASVTREERKRTHFLAKFDCSNISNTSGLLPVKKA